MVAGDSLRTPRLVEVDVKTGDTFEVSGMPEVEVDVAYISTATPIQFPSTQSDFAYGFLYMPKVRHKHKEINEIILLIEINC